MTKTYIEKLKDPRWQKKRLEILERDDWACQACFDQESTLHVHHKRYLPKKEPWEYNENLLVTLCESCHEDESVLRKDVESDLIQILRERFLYKDFYTLVSGFAYFYPIHCDYIVVGMLTEILCDEEKQRQSIKDYFINLRRIKILKTSKAKNEPIENF